MHLNDPVHKSVLANGLRVVTVELGHLHAGMLAAYVRAGSRHEEAQKNGVSHFLEHLFFRGSTGYPDGRLLNSVVEDVGGNLNGVTTRDHGYYYTPVHPQRLGIPFAVLGDMLARPLFKEVELEREVILEEILDEVDEEGRDIDVDNLSKRALFADHPLGQKIAGTRETVAELRRLLAELCDEEVSEDELRRAKVRHRIGLEFALDSAGEMIGWFGGTELFRPPEGFAERVARMEAVTAAEVRAVARKVLRRDGLVACAVGPLASVETRLASAVDDAQGLVR